MHNQFKTQKFKHLMLAMGRRDLNSAPYSPVHCSSHSMTSFQSSEFIELPVVENSQLFAQRTVRPLYLTTSPEMAPKERKPIGHRNCINTLLPTNIAQARAQYNQLLCRLCHQFIPTCVDGHLNTTTRFNEHN